MSQLFLEILNMSLTSIYVIICVILVRLLLRKAPKAISYALWGVVGLRLVIPSSFESVLSLIPRKINTSPIPQDIIYQENPQINSGIEVIDSAVNNLLPAATTEVSANPLQILTEIGAYIWIVGIIALLVYSIVSVLVLKSKLESAKLITANIYIAKNLKTPFVLGMMRPKIFLPYGLKSEEKEYILLHEQIHIKRKDHIIKPFAFLILTIHWFNPFVLISFILMSKDMELSCDERVLREMDGENKKSYANSLLSLATKKQILNGSPLAFGEGNVKGRIKNILNYKSTSFWLVIVSIMIVIAVGIGLISNPKTDMDEPSYEESLWTARTENVGDNSAVANLISLLMIPEGLQYDHLKLHTKELPYAVEIVYLVSGEGSNIIDMEDEDLLNVLRNNSIILLALIDNVDQIRSTIINGEDQSAFVIGREWADDNVGRDVRDYAESPSELRKLIDLIQSSYPFENNAIDSNSINTYNINANSTDAMDYDISENHIMLEAGEWPENTYTSGIPQPDSGKVVNGWIDPDMNYCYIEMEGVSSGTIENWYDSLLKNDFNEVERMAEEIKNQDYISTNAVLQSSDGNVNMTHLSNDKGTLVLYITKNNMN